MEVWPLFEAVCSGLSINKKIQIIFTIKPIAYEIYHTSLCVTFSVYQLNAQTINGVPVSEIKSPHVLIVGTSKLLSNKVNIHIDFGQEDKVLVAKDTQIKAADGRLMTFNSMIDALNFMTENDYEFVEAYATNIENRIIHYWLMRKSKN